MDLLWYDGPTAVLAAPGPPVGDDGWWARAVALGACARYAEAAQILAGQTSSRAASTLASHARQVGRPEEAGPLDERALALATTTADRADAATGLLADAVAGGDPERASALVPSARQAALADGEWRSRTRLCWVLAELALLAGHALTAAADADEAVATTRAAAAPRHLTKSLLVRGVARHAAGAGSAAIDLLAALDQARTQGLTSLVWPAAVVAAGAVPTRASELLAMAADAAAAIVAGLGPRGAAFAARPDVAGLLTQRSLTDDRR